MRFRSLFAAAAVLLLSGCCTYYEATEDASAPYGVRFDKKRIEDCDRFWGMGMWGGALALTMASGASGSHTSAPTGTTVP